MPDHFATHIVSHPSPGVVIVPQDMSIGDAARELCLIWVASEAEEWTNLIRRLPL